MLHTEPLNRLMENLPRPNVHTLIFNKERNELIQNELRIIRPQQTVLQTNTGSSGMLNQLTSSHGQKQQQYTLLYSPHSPSASNNPFSTVMMMVHHVIRADTDSAQRQRLVVIQRGHFLT